MFVPNNVNSASFGSRAMALTIDFVLLEIIYFFAYGLFHPFPCLVRPDNRQDDNGNKGGGE